MGIKIWHILAAWGVALLFGTIGAADMGVIDTTQIIVQILLGIALIITAYRWFLTACDRYYKKRWSKYGKR